MPSIGYGSNKKTKHMLPTGFRKVLVHNVKVHLSVFIILLSLMNLISVKIPRNNNDFLEVGNEEIMLMRTWNYIKNAKNSTVSLVQWLFH